MAIVGREGSNEGDRKELRIITTGPTNTTQKLRRRLSLHPFSLLLFSLFSFSPCPFSSAQIQIPGKPTNIHTPSAHFATLCRSLPHRPPFQGVSSSHWPLLADSLCLLCLGHSRFRFTFLTVRGLSFRHPARPGLWLSACLFGFGLLSSVLSILYFVPRTLASERPFFFFFSSPSSSFFFLLFFSILTFSLFVNP